MSNNAYSAITGRIASDLAAVTQLQDTENSVSIDFSGFPACRWYLDRVEIKPLDNKPTGSDEFWYFFTVEIWQEITNKSKPNAEADLGAAIEAVLKKLRSDWQLGGNCDNSVVHPSPIQRPESAQGPACVMRISLAVMTLIE